MQVQCSKCGGDTDTSFRCVKCGHPMQPHTGGTQTTDTQQLKAEISLGVGSIARDSSIPAVDRLDRIVVFVNEKLSTI